MSLLAERNDNIASLLLEALGLAGDSRMRHVTYAIYVIAGLVLIYFVAALFPEEPFLALVNSAGPIVLLLVCIYGARHAITASHHAFLTPLPWFFIASAAYFGFGPLVYHFGTPESVDYCHSFYYVNEYALFQTNLLNAIGVLCVLIGFLVGRQIIFGRVASTTRWPEPQVSLMLIIVFLSIGLSIKFLLAFPYYMGWISWTLPGAIQFLATFSRFTIILLFVYVHQTNGNLRWLLIGLITEEFVVALMTLTKLAVIEVILATAAGWYLTKRPTVKRLAAAGAGLAMLYVLVLSPFVAYGRLLAGSVGVGSLAQVGESVSGFVGQSGRDELAEILPGVQGWWTRLAYSNAQAFAMHDFEHGKGGGSLANIPFAFVPRLLYQDKPVMTPGREFTEIVTGDASDTATAAGIFAEAYWNGGWPLLAIVSIGVGILFWKFTQFAEKHISSGNLQYLPIVMIGMTIGYSPCDWLVSTFVGPGVNAIALFAIFRIFVVPLIRATENNRSPASSA